MQRKLRRPLILQVPADPAFLRLAPSFVDRAAAGLGFAEDPAEELALAAEEVMAHLVRICPGSDIEISCHQGSHFIRIDFGFPRQSLDLAAFNLTASIDLDNEADLDAMGLLIASRLVDRFRISTRPDGNPVLTLIKDYPYQEMPPAPAVDRRPLAGFTVKEPDEAQIRWFLGLVQQFYPPELFPVDFLYPGKIVDMAAAGEYRLLLAVGPAGEIGGGIAWREDGQKTAEVSGPYIFVPEPAAEMASRLMDGCVSAVARTPAQVLLSRTPTPEMPAGSLEPLGMFTSTGRDDGRQQVTAYFRELHEDLGAVSWTHPDLQPFLEETYRRLYFPREIRPVTSCDEADAPGSVLSAGMDRRLGQATLRPIWPGSDRRENLAAHIELLRGEGMSSILFELDLGCAWQAGFAPDLADLGFSPRLILPHAGEGDLLLFELQRETP
jgi:anti-sigma regulatory factor (Ser/Thr protein kinase)